MTCASYYGGIRFPRRKNLKSSLRSNLILRAQTLYKHEQSVYFSSPDFLFSSAWVQMIFETSCHYYCLNSLRLVRRPVQCVEQDGSDRCGVAASSDSDGHIELTLLLFVVYMLSMFLVFPSAVLRFAVDWYCWWLCCWAVVSSFYHGGTRCGALVFLTVCIVDLFWLCCILSLFAFPFWIYSVSICPVTLSF